MSSPVGDSFVYAGTGNAPIREIAEKLGAKVDWDPTTNQVTVNGKVVPWNQVTGGKAYGDINTIADLAGGRVEKTPEGAYMVYKSPTATPATQPAAGGTQVTGSPATASTGAPGDPLRAVAASATGGTQVTGNPTTAAADPLADVKAKVAAGDSAGAAAILQQKWGLTPEQAQANLQAIAAGTTPANTASPNGQWTGAVSSGDPAGAYGMPQQPASGSPAFAPAPAPTTLAVSGTPAPGPTYSLPPQYQLPPFSYQDQPVDYNALATRAQSEAAMWAAPYLQQLRDAAAQAQQGATNEAGYIRGDLQTNIADLRAGEAGREQRINEDMNRRGDAIYNSGVRFGAVAQQQTNAYNQEVSLTGRAQNALQKVADSLGLKLQDIASKAQLKVGEQGDKALMTLQQLADKAQTQQFENRKFAWQMWIQGAQLTVQQQQQANQLWLGVQQIKSTDDRAAAEQDLKRSINAGQLQLEWSKLTGVLPGGTPTLDAQKWLSGQQNELSKMLGYVQGPDGQTVPTFEARKWSEQRTDDMLKAAGYVRGADGSLVRTVDGQRFDLASAESLSKQTGYIVGLDGKPLTDPAGDLVPTLDRAKFDWSKKEFLISEEDKTTYQNGLLQLRQQQLINDQQYQDAQMQIRRGELNLSTARLLGQAVDEAGNPIFLANGDPYLTEDARHNRAMEAANTGSQSTAYKSLVSELEQLANPVGAFGGSMGTQQRAQLADQVWARYAPQLSPADMTAIKAYFDAMGWGDHLQ